MAIKDSAEVDLMIGTLTSADCQLTWATNCTNPKPGMREHWAPFYRPSPPPPPAPPPLPPPKGAMNVLMVAIDDMRPELEPYRLGTIIIYGIAAHMSYMLHTDSTYKCCIYTLCICKIVCVAHKCMYCAHTEQVRPVAYAHPEHAEARG